MVQVLVYTTTAVMERQQTIWTMHVARTIHMLVVPAQYIHNVEA